MLRFNARGPEGLLDRKPLGQPCKPNDGQRQVIARMVESGPIAAVHGVVRWRLIDLAQWIFEEFRITIAKPTLSRELRAMGYRETLARPRHHAQAEGAIEDFKKTSPRVWTQSRATRRSTATRSKSGSQTRLVLARRTRSLVGGPSTTNRTRFGVPIGCRSPRKRGTFLCRFAVGFWSPRPIAGCPRGLKRCYH